MSCSTTALGAIRILAEMCIDRTHIYVCATQITSAWVETCEIGGADAGNMDFEIDSVVSRISSNSRYKSSSSYTKKKSLDLNITVPERINLKIIGQEVNVTFRKKVTSCDLSFHCMPVFFYLTIHLFVFVCTVVPRQSAFDQ